MKRIFSIPATSAPAKTRGAFAVLALVMAVVALTASTHAQPPVQQKHAPSPAPAARRTTPPAAAPATSSIIGIQRRENPGQKPQNGEHLAGWLDHHSNLTPAQQQQALEQEPGFHDLPPQTQQRYRERLSQLNNMTPEQRNHTIAQTEAMEKLTPEQRGQVRNSMQQLAALPPDRKRVVARTFRNLRLMQPATRQAYLNSPEFRTQFSDNERATLNNLMNVEPLLPKPE